MNLGRSGWGEWVLGKAAGGMGVPESRTSRDWERIAAGRGSLTRKVDPSPGTLSTSITPWCLWMME